MRVTFRTKLLAIVGVAVAAFLVRMVVGGVISERVVQQLGSLRDHYVPRVELGPALTLQFERLRRGYQDAVASHDPDAIAATQKVKDELLGRIDAAGKALEPGDAAALRSAIEAYDVSARDVSRRLISGETGEALVDAMGVMQAKQAAVTTLLKADTVLDRQDLDGAFATALAAELSARRMELGVSTACVILLLLTSSWLSRNVLRTLGALTTGFERFGRSEFEPPIQVLSRDELGAVAERANAMARNLQRLDEERARADWLKSGQVGLVQEIRGELDPTDLAARAVGFLARYLEAPAAALYGWSELDEVLKLLAQHARAGEARGPDVPTFKRGEGLVGQAALGQDLVVIADPPPDYLRIRSGLGEAGPRAVVLLPLTNGGQLTGVLELAFFKPWSAASGELLLQIRETLSVALGMAQARSAMRTLLGETQRQAARLAAQEEELRATNDELQAQQEELQQANEELSHQTHELEAQRRTLEASNHELDLAQRTLQQKANELVTVSAYKSQFLANMSHELRTPLNSMLLLSNLLAENETGNLSEKQVQYSRTIHGAGTDLLGLINQVLDLAKIESGKQELNLAPTPLRGLLDHAHHVFEPLAREKQLEFHATLDPSLPEQIVTDGKRVVQVLNNLLGNAIKFTTRGSVALHIGRPAPDARLTHPGLKPEQTLALQVVDTGVGIAPEHQQRVFAPFEQVEAASDRRFGGTGLGLSIARELAGLLGGELQLHSAPGQGSRFVCFLPFAAPSATAAGAAAIETPAVQPQSSVALAPSTGHLLLIEDDPVFAETFAEVIRSQGVECQLARDGQTGLEMARKHRPAGIILDVKLPGLDGWRVMDLLDADPATADIPVYFVSALDGRERGMAMGAVGYLNKPATRGDLLRVVGSLVPGPASRPCRILVVDADAGAADLAQALELEGFQVRRVDRAGAARAALQAERFDCVVIDPALPDVDGLEFLRSLDPQPTVLVHTARALTRDEVQRLQAYEAVVLKEGASGERLLEELRLFVRRLNQAPGRRRPAAAAAELGSVRLDGRKLLVVDDDMRTVFALSALLRAKGAEVLVADTGLAALELLDANTDVEAVLMDIMMPEMDGYEAMRRIRADRRFAALPILSLTAKAMKGDEQRSLEAGATAYLPKPIDADRLLQVLGGWFSGKRAHGS